MSIDNNCKARRVVVTGMGTVNPIGKSLNEFWENLLTGKSGISRIDSFDIEKIYMNLALEYKKYKAKYIDKVKNPEDVDFDLIVESINQF